jgi:hypothetical protein
MPDKQCPNCHIWNSENAEVCDCGYNFISNNYQLSPKKDEELKRVFGEEIISEEKVTAFDKNIILRILVSLSILFLIYVKVKNIVPYWGYIRTLIYIFIIIVNVYTNNKYYGNILRRLWKYTIIGIISGYILFFCSVLIFQIMTFELGIKIENEYFMDNYYNSSIISVMYLLGLIGLFIGKSKLIIENKRYFELKTPNQAQEPT